MSNHRVCLAPMLGYTDRHFRYLLRLISKHIFLYTEMVSSSSILHSAISKNDRLYFNDYEHPVALQLAGDNPQELAQCAQLAEQYGYDEINLNVGCPSKRVQKGNFGACLMFHPALVAESVQAIQDVTSIPVTIKTRIGIQEAGSTQSIESFMDELLARCHCHTFIIHARVANLQQSTRSNRSDHILNEAAVRILKQSYPGVEIILNGGIKTIHDVQNALEFYDGVMVGRALYAHPYEFNQLDNLIFNDDHNVFTPREVVKKYLEYAEGEMALGAKAQHLLRHLTSFFKGYPFAKEWRRLVTREEVSIGLLVDYLETH